MKKAKRQSKNYCCSFTCRNGKRNMIGIDAGGVGAQNGMEQNGIKQDRIEQNRMVKN